MSDCVIVRINQQLIPEFQINYSANNTVASKQVISLWSEILLNKHEVLILLLPANLVLTSQVKIPSKNDEIIRQSIPFALEELLANEVTDNHYAYRQLSDQNFLVSVIETQLMNKIIDELAKNNLQCKELYSELFTVPFYREKISIIAQGDYCIVRNENTGTCLSNQLLEAYIKASKTNSLIVYSQQDLDVSDLLASDSDGFENINVSNKKGDVALLQAIAITTDDKINLFQAQYAQNDESYKAKDPWKRIATLTITLIVSWLIINVYSLVSVSSEINDLKQQQAELLIELIPNASETERRDPYSAIQSRLKSTQNQTTNKGNGFILSLTYLGQTLAQHNTIQIISLRQRDSKLEVSLRANDTGRLNAFQSSLENNVLGMRIKTGTREVSNGGVNSVITMETL